MVHQFRVLYHSNPSIGVKPGARKGATPFKVDPLPRTKKKWLQPAGEADTVSEGLHSERTIHLQGAHERNALRCSSPKEDLPPNSLLAKGDNSDE